MVNFKEITPHNRPDGTVFTAPSVKGLEIKRGDVVSFEYTAFSRKQIPTHPRILRRRVDVSWKDVVRDHLQSVSSDTKSSQSPPKASSLNGMYATSHKNKTVS